MPWNEEALRVVMDYMHHFFDSFPNRFVPFRQICEMFAEDHSEYFSDPEAVQKSLLTIFTSKTSISIRERAICFYRFQTRLGNIGQREFKMFAKFNENGRIVEYKDDELEMGVPSNQKLIDFMNSQTKIDTETRMLANFLRWRIENLPVYTDYLKRRLSDFIVDLQETNESAERYVNIDMETRVELLSMVGWLNSEKWLEIINKPRPSQPIPKPEILRIFDELSSTFDYIPATKKIDLKTFLEEYKNEKNLNFSVEDLVDGVSKFLKRGLIPTSKEINFQQKMKFFYFLEFPVPMGFLDGLKAIYQVDDQNRLIFWTYQRFRIGQRNMEINDNLSNIQSDILRCIQIIATDHIYLTDMIQRLRDFEPVFRNAPGEQLEEEYQKMRFYLESEDQTNFFTMLHTLYLTQTPVTMDFKRRAINYQVFYNEHDIIQRYIASKVSLNLDRMNGSWLEDVDVSTTEPEIPNGPSEENMDPEEMEILKQLNFTLRTTIQPLKEQELRDVHNRALSNLGPGVGWDLTIIDQLKDIVENCDMLTKLRILFGAQLPITKEFEKKYGKRYQMVLDNTGKMAYCKIPVNFIIDRKRGIKFEECFKGKAMQIKPLEDEPLPNIPANVATGI